MSFPAGLLDLGILPPNRTDHYLDYMHNLSAEIAQQDLKDVHFLQLSDVGLPTEGWCASHPSVAAHHYIAQQVAAFIQSIRPDWALPAGQLTFAAAAAQP